MRDRRGKTGVVCRENQIQSTDVKESLVALMLLLLLLLLLLFLKYYNSGLII